MARMFFIIKGLSSYFFIGKWIYKGVKMENIDFKKHIREVIKHRRDEFKEGKIVIIDEVKNNYIYENLFKISKYESLDDINSKYKINSGVNFISKDLLYEREDDFLEFIKENKKEIDFLIYGLDELANNLYKEENNILKVLSKLHFKTILILNRSEEFTLEELLYHHQYAQKELNIKNFFITKDRKINNRIVNQYEDICNYIYGNISMEYKNSFAMGQLVNEKIKEKHISEELVNIYNEILLIKDQEVLNKLTVVELCDITNLVKEEFMDFYNLENGNLEIIDIENGVIENIIGKAFHIDVNEALKSKEKLKILDSDEDNEIIKGFLDNENFNHESNNKEIELSECEKTAIMDLNEDEILKYNLTNDLESEFLSNNKQREELRKKENSEIKKLSIINMSEDRTFKEVTISDQYGINEEFEFEESEDFTPIQQIEEIDDKLKEVIWGNDEIAMDELDDFQLTEGSSKKYKKINMNGEIYN